jgi:hypothetical protein
MLTVSILDGLVASATLIVSPPVARSHGTRPANICLLPLLSTVL